MLINCDIGERGADNKIDRELMKYIDIANIACGGHAGDEESVREFRKLADKYGVTVSAHLSYPDKENFGRTSQYCGIMQLLESLSIQYSLMPDVKIVKFHGGLYNDSVTNEPLCDYLSAWLISHEIESLICPVNSAIANTLKQKGSSIEILGEAFAERNYNYNTKMGQLTLVNRDKDHASLSKLDDALLHSQRLRSGIVLADKDDDNINKIEVKIQACTLCIHSDSNIALNLAKKLREANNV